MSDATAEEAALVQALRDAGFQVRSVYDLVNMKGSYKTAIPILLEHLGRVSHPAVKEGIARALTVKEARGVAATPLVKAFERAEQTMVKWAIGNALAIVADESVFEDIVRLVKDPQHGMAREMLAVALGNFKTDASVETLVQLLDDEQTAGHAITALGKLKASGARSRIEQFLDHEKAWVRQEAKRALARMDG